MRIVVDDYPRDCYDCPLSKIDYSKQQRVCYFGFDKINCNDNFITYEMIKEEYELRQKFNSFEIGSLEFGVKYENLKRTDKEYKDSLKKNKNKRLEEAEEKAVEKKRLSFIGGTIRDNNILTDDLVKFNDDMNKLLQSGKENIEKGREGTIVIPKKEADDIIKRNEEEIKRQREEALSKASKGGFLDTGSVVSIGDEIRKVKDKVREMDNNFHHKEDSSIDEDIEDKTLTKEQAAEMMCENFGGLI